MEQLRNDIKHFTMLKRKVLEEVNNLPRGQVLMPTPEANALEAFAYKEIEQVLGDMKGLSFMILKELEECGLIESEFYDRLLLCPHCRSYNLCFRDICPECSSSNIELIQMIHHFRCGYVGPEHEFINEKGTLTCPKCSYKLLSVGKDYEKPAEVFNCLSCDWSGSETMTMGRCIVCNNSSEPQDCIIFDVNSYRITPLGKLALETGDLGNYLEKKEVNLLEKEDSFSNVSNLMALAKELGRIAKRYGYNQSVMCLYPDCFNSMKVTDDIKKSFTSAVMEKVRSLLRLTDYVACDENAVMYAVLPHTDLKGAEILASRILQTISESPFSGPIAQSTISIGVVGWDPDYDAEPTFARAEKLMQQIIRDGGNAYNAAIMD